MRLERDGGVTVLIGSQSTGQGHATSYAQLVAERLDLPPERVRVVQGDTDLIATGAGTGGSSSIPVGGVSVDRASKTLAEQLKELAADALEAARRRSGNRRRHGARRRHRPRRFRSPISPRVPRPRPRSCAPRANSPPTQPTFPNGTHIAEVEIDPDTGATAILNYVIVDDFGATLNPLLLAGQVHGGAVQGIGQALMEDTVYDAGSGQLLSASLMDYALPRAADAPDFVFETRNVPCKTNPLGVKGAGEAGAIGSCPAVMNAIVDALWRATASATSTCRRPRSGSGRRSRRPETPTRILRLAGDHELVIRCGVTRVLPNSGISQSRMVFAVRQDRSEPSGETHENSLRRCATVAVVALGVTAVVAQQDPIAARKALMKDNGAACRGTMVADDARAGAVRRRRGRCRLRAMGRHRAEIAGPVPGQFQDRRRHRGLAEDLGEQERLRRASREVRQGRGEGRDRPRSSTSTASRRRFRWSARTATTATRTIASSKS